MPIEWSIDRAAVWEGEERVERDVLVASRWRLRLVSDRAERRGGVPPSDFAAVVDRDLEIWIRPFASSAPLERSARGTGADLEIVEDITLGLRHETSVQVKPSDDTLARWSCTCGAGSRGTAAPDLAQEAAQEHVLLAPDRRTRPRDHAVAQLEDGTWARQEIGVARRFRICARSDFSAVKVHQLGYGEEFELVVDTRLGLWTRRLGHEAALRRDEGASGVSLLVAELI